MTGALLLVLGAGALTVAAGFLAACLRLESPVAFVLATQLIAWTLLVLVTLALSPFELVTRTATAGWLVLVVGASVACWSWAGRPRAPVASARRRLSEALGDPLVALLAACCAVALVYAVALAVGTPENEGDALAYHVPRAALWYQQHAVAYVANAADTRLNANPPNAEIGLLFTMLLSGTQRFVGLVQIASLLVCATATVGIARRIGLQPAAAVFGGLLCVTLPVVVTQSWTAQNDLVVAALIATAAYFVVGSMLEVALAGLATGLAIGTKFTGVLALPLLVAVALAAPAADRLRRVGVLVGAGIACGSVWYLVNLAETGELEGGLAARQTPSHTLAATFGTLERFVYDVLDLSGVSSSEWRWDRHVGASPLVFRILGVALLLLGLVLVLRRRRRAAVTTAIGGGIIVATAPSAVALAYRLLYAAHRPDGRPVDYSANTWAGATSSWFGPLGVIAFAAGVVVAAVALRRRRVPPLALVVALAPLILAATLAFAITYDPWRGRFVIAGYVVAAAAWGLALERRWLAWGLATVGAVTLALGLVNAQSKPSGLRFLDQHTPGTVWSKPDWWVQSVLRRGPDGLGVTRLVATTVPHGVTLAVAARGNDFLSPYFGRGLDRRILLVRDGASPPADATWLLEAPGVRLQPCGGGWRVVGRAAGGWTVSQKGVARPCGVRPSAAPAR